MPVRLFTPEEDAFIREWYGKISAPQIGLKLGRHADSIRRRAKRINANFAPEVYRQDGSTFRRWTHEEVEKLKEMYPTHSKHEIALAIGRDSDCVAHKAKSLKLSKRKYRKDGDVYVWRCKGHAHRLMIIINGKHRGYRRWLWEQHHGPVPDGFKVITKDGNNLNIVIENLELITDRLIFYRNNPRLTREEGITYDLLAKIKDHCGIPRTKNKRRKNGKKNNTPGPEQPAV